MKILLTFYSIFLLFSLTVIYSCNTQAPAIVIPAAPTGLNAAVASNTQIDLVWTDNATNETGYKVQRKTAGSTFNEIGTCPSNATTFSDVNVAANTTYTYRVCSYNTARIQLNTPMKILQLS